MNEYYYSLSIKYDNGDLQYWNYDGAQFNTMSALKRNMTADFKDPRMDRKNVVVFASGYDGIRSPISIKLNDEKGSEFTKLVFSEIEKRVDNGN